MHVPDGFVPIAVSGAGYVATAGITWYSLRKINQDPDYRSQIPKASLLTAAFFISSLIHIPVPPTSVHLLLSGVLGVMLGWFAFPAILIGLLFQAIMFQHGGITTLGVNAIIMGAPALLAGFIFRQSQRRLNRPDWWDGAFAFISGGLAILLSVGLFYTVMVSSIPATLDIGAERAAITTLSLAHLPLIFAEGLITALLFTYLKRVRPDMLKGLHEARA